MKKLAVIAILAGLVTLSGCAGQAFNEARQVNTVTAYDNFLRQYPEHDLAKEARQLREKAVLSAKSTEKVPDCPRFTGCGPCPDDRQFEELRRTIYAQNAFLDDRRTEIYNLVCIFNLNTATKKELKFVIKGIDRILAKRIIAGRPYKTIDDLKKIKGIDQKKLETIRSDCFGSE